MEQAPELTQLQPLEVDINKHVRVMACNQLPKVLALGYGQHELCRTLYS